MGKILNTLETQLKDFLLEGETMKTWTQWSSWLESQGCPFQLKCPAHLQEDRMINYQNMLSACESQMTSYPEWQAKLCTPSWLQLQRIKLVPSVLKKGGRVPKGNNLKALNTELSRLVDQIHSLQDEMENLEPSSASGQTSLAREISNVSRSSRGLPAGAALYRGAETSLMLQRELTVPKRKKLKAHSKETKPESEIVPLKETYLRFNQWLDRFENVGLDLQSFFSKPLRVENSHQISFQQFKHRLLRESLETEELMEEFETFERLCEERVDLNLPGKPSDLADTETSAAGFVPPSDEVYRNFQEWLVWLKESGIDASEFTSEDLDSINSHRISFPQFRRRLERRLDDSETFRRKLKIPGKSNFINTKQHEGKDPADKVGGS